MLFFGCAASIDAVSHFSCAGTGRGTERGQDRRALFLCRIQGGECGQFSAKENECDCRHQWHDCGYSCAAVLRKWRKKSHQRLLCVSGFHQSDCSRNADADWRPAHHCKDQGEGRGKAGVWGGKGGREERVFIVRGAPECIYDEYCKHYARRQCFDWPSLHGADHPHGRHLPVCLSDGCRAKICGTCPWWLRNARRVDCGAVSAGGHRSQGSIWHPCQLVCGGSNHRAYQQFPWDFCPMGTEYKGGSLACRCFWLRGQSGFYTGLQNDRAGDLDRNDAQYRWKWELFYADGTAAWAVWGRGYSAKRVYLCAGCLWLHVRVSLGHCKSTDKESGLWPSGDRQL